MIDVQEVGRLHRKTVRDWHQTEICNPYSGLLSFICEQHCFNFQLWHQEDIARSPVADDQVIANVKRCIDGLNQQRNDWIEKIDDFLTQMLEDRNVRVTEQAPINTETPGSVIDRLSILELRIFHLQEQLDRKDTDQTHRQSVADKLALCQLQQAELTAALQTLLNAIAAGRVRHRTYRQMKMYNDPSLNPHIYSQMREHTTALQKVA